MQKNISIIVLLLSVIAILMFGFCFALVPLYNKYCRLTGVNTSPRETEFNQLADLSRTITVEFVNTNNQNGPWKFEALQNKITVHPGEVHRVSFIIKNNVGKQMILQAIPSFAPFEAARYFHKIECFCFTQQIIKPYEKKIMP